MLLENLENLEHLLYLPDDIPFFGPDDPSHRWSIVRRIAALVALAFIVYVPAMGNGFVWQDDLNVLPANVPRALSGLWAAWMGHGGEVDYHPVAQTFWYVEHRLFGVAPAGYHVLGLMLHALNGAMLWMVLRRLAVPGAWLGAALFLVHPVQAQAVVWVSQQPLLLATALALGAAWAYLRLSEIRPPLFGDAAQGFGEQGLPPEPCWRLYGLSFLLFAGSLLSDPVGAAMPPALLLILFWKQGVVTLKQWLLLAPFFAAMAASLGFSVWMGSEVAAGSVMQRALAAALAAGFHVQKAACPYPLLFVYPNWAAGTFSIWHYLPSVLLLAGFVGLWLSRRRLGVGPLVALGIYLVLLLPVCGLLFPPGGLLSFAADHLQYLALAPLVALAAASLTKLVGRLGSAPKVRLGRLISAAICAAVLGLLTWRQAQVYFDEKTLWTDTIAKDPSSTAARSHYAMLLLRQGRPDLAADQLQDDRGEPGDVSLLIARARIHVAGERYADAVRCLRAARSLQPANREVLNDLADAYARDGYREQAIQIYQELLRKRPADEQAHNNLGLVLAEEGKLPEAIEQYRAAIEANTRFIPARLNLSNALFAQGDVTGAATQLQAVIGFDPRNFAAFMNAGAMLGRLKDFAAAERMFHAAVQLQPKSPEALNNLGIAQAAQGNLSEAVWNFNRAVQLNPNFDQARQNLQNARQQLESSRKPSDPLPEGREP